MMAIIALLSPYITPLMGVVTAANAITALTPTRADNKILSIILRILNILAINFLRNKNKDDR